jgi:hypothetical protein
MKNIIEPLIECIQNFQFSDTFEIDEEESYQTKEQGKDDDLSIDCLNNTIDNTASPNDKA